MSKKSSHHSNIFGETPGSSRHGKPQPLRALGTQDNVNKMEGRMPHDNSQDKNGTVDTSHQSSIGNSTRGNSLTMITHDDVPKIFDHVRKAAVEEPPRKLALVPSERKTVKNPIKPQHPNYRPPVLPDWYFERPNLCGAFVDDSSSVSMSPFEYNICQIPTASQETMLLSDALAILQGAEGIYIMVDPTVDKLEPRTFSINSSVDPSMATLVQQILPLASSYSLVASFIHERTQFKYGQVNHALCAAMSQFMMEYTILICQMEHMLNLNALSLQQMWYFIQPTLHTMQILSDVAIILTKSEAKGGRVLTLLNDVTMRNSGDNPSKKVCLHLIQAASVPYMEILDKWVYKGIISDPYSEFLVKDNEVVEKEMSPLDYTDDYWERRYSIEKERVPVFLERVADVILRTGKYLNVIRQCGVSVSFPHAEEIIYSGTERHYVEAIDRAYTFASKTLLNLLLKDFDLLGRLRSVKHYFLLDQGDFIVQLMDSCEAELCKNIDDIIPTRLESLLELVLRTSGANGDPYKDDVRTELLPYDLNCQMFKILSISTEEEEEHWHLGEKKELTGLESFAFGYAVKWPVSLVLNRRSIACYQMIFRHLFYCKHVERSLCRVWICNKAAKSFPLATSSDYSPAFTLRQRMLNCVQNLEYYMMVEIIEPNWVQFLARMENVNNFDEVLRFHNDFVDSCLKDCMLTNPNLLTRISNLMRICIKFCQFIQSPEPTSESMIDVGESFEKSIKQFDIQFTAVLVGLLEKIAVIGHDGDNQKVINILYRLDFNNFYTRKYAPSNSRSLLSNSDLLVETSG